MVSKDQTIGGVILVICVVIALFYTVTLFYPEWMKIVGVSNMEAVRFWLVAVPVFIAFVAVMAIGAWIGFTMATTPPPKPIEEITKELEEKTEEKVEEVKTEEKAAETEESEEKKKPERKKKS